MPNGLVFGDGHAIQHASRRCGYGRHVGRVGKIIISSFILLTMLVWAWRHTPDWWDRWYWRQVDKRLTPTQAAAVREAPVAINWYAHKIGLDNRWALNIKRGNEGLSEDIITYYYGPEGTVMLNSTQIFIVDIIGNLEIRVCR